MLPAGRLKTLLTIKRITAPADDYRDRAAEWSVYAKGWFEAKFESGSESVDGEQNTGKKRWIFRGHYTPQLAGVTSADRAELPDGTILGIVSAVNEDLSNRVLQLTCEATT